MTAAIYARVSTFDQEPENQLAELGKYVEVRGWTAVEYVDKGVSGAKDRRPALDQLVRDATHLEHRQIGSSPVLPTRVDPRVRGEDTADWPCIAKAEG
jgi:DNA invertase Pin-like site-specific DNA recombinase